MNNDKPIFITGGCGFVGRHLVRNLLEKNKSIWIVDDLSTGWHPDRWLKYKERREKNNVITYMLKNGVKVFFIRMDALSFFQQQVTRESNLVVPEFCDIYHLSSIVGGRVLIDGDPILVATDLGIDALFFVWATRNKEKFERILYASSSAAYPIHLQNVKDKPAIALAESLISFENHIGQPDMTYGWSKLTGEFLSRLAAESYGLHISCVRPFSGYGDDQDVSYPIPAIARRIARRDSPVEVWGSGKQSRDFIYIDDCIDAMFIALDNVSDGSGVNIGSGILTSFIEIIKIFAEIEGYNPKIKPILDKPIGVQSRYADITLIKSFGWKPKYSLKDGLEKVLDYAKKEIPS
ncbi:MAG TPA: NAD-dependent epimerase/dehydratase family protein [Thermodesulfobacteriota bacterium]